MKDLAIILVDILKKTECGKNSVDTAIVSHSPSSIERKRHLRGVIQAAGSRIPRMKVHLSTAFRLSGDSAIKPYVFSKMDLKGAVP